MENTTRQISLLSSSLAQELNCSEKTAQKVLSVLFDCSAKAAVEEIKKQEARKSKSKVTAVRKILREYNRIRESVACAVTGTADVLENTEIQRLMQQEESVKNRQVRALALQAGKSSVLLAQINSALKNLKRISQASGKPAQKRQYGLIYYKYIAGYGTQEILEKFHIERTVYYENLRTAEETLALLMFGANSAQEELYQPA